MPRVMYPSRKGGKPLNIGMNRAKRIARSADRRDQLIVQRELGPGLPRQHKTHQSLVQRRHEYYGDVYEETQNERLRLEAQKSGSPSADAQDSGDADRAVPEPEAGPTDQ